MTDGFEQAPTRFSTVTALGSGFVATASVALGTPITLAVGIPGMVAVFAGIHNRSRRLLSAGVIGVLAGTMIAGMSGTQVLTVLVSATAGVLCWDYGTTAISVGTQLGRRADTERLERVHSLTSLGVGAVTVVLSYGIYRSIGGSHPVAAVFFLILTVILLAGTLR